MAGAQEIPISFDPATGAFVSGVLSRVKWDSLNVSYGVPWSEGFYGSDYERTIDPEGEAVGPTDVDETNGFIQLNALQNAAVEAGVREVMALTNLVLTRNNVDPGQTDIRFAMTTTPGPTPTQQFPTPTQWTAYASLPIDGWEGGEIWFNTVSYNDPTPGSYAYQTFFHEFGHALGLKHGHAPQNEPLDNSNVLPSGFDSLEFSTMTYSSYVGAPTANYLVRAGDYPMTYMLADIAALQYMYGANFNTNNGDTTYRFSNTTGQMSINGAVQEAPASEDASVTNTLFRTIWDGGGTDTYDFSLYATPLDVDLAPGRWTDVDRTSNLQAASLNGQVGSTGIYARGQVFNALLYNGNPASLIENAIGGSNADILRGNFGPNGLEGRAANDTLDGDAGDDWLDGGEGDDLLEGRGGADTLVGDIGTDTADYRRATGDVVASLNQPNGLGSGGLGDGPDILIGIENLWGSVHDDYLTGDVGGNWLWGWQGGDRLDGAGGADLLQGDAGDDVLRGGEGDDTLEGGNENDTLEGGGGYNGLFGGNGNDVIRSGFAEEELNGGDGFDVADYGGSPSRIMIDLRIGSGKFYAGDAFGDSFVSIEAIWGSSFDDVMNGSDVLADIASGGGGNDSFAGHGGNDSLNGGNHADTLAGGAGTDLLDGGDGDDMLIGGEGADTLRGGDGFDVVSFEGNGLWIDLNSSGGGDVLSGIEGAAGTVGGDTIFGTGVGNFILGRAGDDQLYGDLGNDTLQGGDDWDHHDGGDGFDLVSYRDRPEARNIDLGRDRGDGTYGKVSGSDSGDTFVSIEDVEGTQFNDTIVGNAGFNILYGLGGDDELRSDDGDALWGGTDNDSFFTSGFVYAYGEAGKDAVAFTGTAGAVGLNLANQGLNSGAAQFGRFFGIETFYGTAANDTFAGAADAVSFYGLTGNDILFGSTAADTLGGGAAADYMDGGLGFDVADYAGDSAGVLVDLRAFLAVHGEAQGDTIYGMEGVAGGAGNDSLGGTDLDNRLEGRGGHDYLSTYGGADTLSGGAGADSMEGGTGADSLDGGEGDDVLGDNEQVLLLFSTDDPFGDTLLGGAGADSLMAMSGDDLLDGGSGVDTMSGGVGNDSYVVDDAGDLVIEADEVGADTVYSDLDIALPDNVEALSMGAPTATAATGNALGNTLVGNGVANWLRGLAGNDTLEGGAGSDTLDGDVDLQMDWLFGGADDDTYVVGEIADLIYENFNGGFDRVLASISWTLAANVEALKLTAPMGAAGTGNELDNLIEGDAGSDTLDGGEGADSLAGGTGDDAYWVDDAADATLEVSNAGADTVHAAITWALGAHIEGLMLTGDLAINGTGNALNNRISGNAAGNALNGASGHDTLDGDAGNDTLQGATGNDSLMGGAGADSLNGAGGTDAMAGGDDNDIYVVDSLLDVIVEGANAGLDTVVTSLSYVLGANIEALVLTGGDFVTGTGNSLGNQLTGNNAANLLAGGGGADSIVGSNGTDTLTGGVGADTTSGGLGNDRHILESLLDVVVELVGEGIDQIVASVSWTLSEHVENLQLSGTGVISGTGNNAINRLAGNDAANVLLGHGSNDNIIGGGGNDTLDGGAGRDALTGGAGSDWFVFASPLEGPDRINDFAPGVDDIAVLASGFGGLPVGSLAAAKFVAHASNATTSAAGTSQFIYNTAIGALLFDADGVGGGAAVRVATLGGTPGLSVGDIIII